MPVFAQISPVNQIPQLASTHGMKGTRVQQRSEVEPRTQRLFARVDANRDGVLDQAEIATVGERRRGPRDAASGAAAGPGPRDRSAMFDRIDANRDGAISRDEFANAAGRGNAMRRDRDGDGQTDGARGMGGRRMAMARLFTTADANRDGRVNPQEATVAALQNFDRLDANRDGQLTPDERRAGRANWQQLQNR